MFKLLIVDDEQPSLRNIEAMVNWPDLLVTHVETCCDAAAALEVEMNLHADIIVTDINMPGINGIELIRRVRQRNPDVQAIFVSGYEFFGFAREALALDAVEYLLKPVNRQELVNAILAATARISDRLDRTNRLNTLNTAVIQSMPLIESRMLQDMIYGIADAYGAFNKLSQYLRVPEQGDNICLLLCEIDSASADSELATLTATRKVSALAGELNIMSYGIMVSPVGINRLAVLLFSSPKTGSAEFAGNAGSYCRSIISAARERLGFTVTIARSSPCGSVHALPQRYDECHRGMERKMFLGGGIVIDPQPLQDCDGTMLFLEGIDDDLARTIAIGDNAKLEYLLDNLFDRIADARMGSKNYIQSLFINILSRINITMMEMGMDVKEVVMSPELIGRILAIETISDVKRWMKDLLMPLNEEIAGKRNDNCRRIKTRLAAFVEKNYMRDVTLLDFASEIGYSANHAGFLIKKACGRNFSEFLMEARMKKASALIKSTNMHVYKVANSVGYNSIPAFLKNFRKVFRMTPSEYKAL